MELEQINKHLGEIDKDFKKGKKEVCSHIIKNLPKGYSGLRIVIQMEDDHLECSTKNQNHNRSDK